MPRANIDLSWLASLLTGTPTASNSVNPDFALTQYDPENTQAYTDPLTGNTSKALNPNPYNTPSRWQHLVHPEQSAQIDQLNNQFSSYPLIAQMQHNTQLGLGASDYAQRPDWAKLNGVTPIQGAIMQTQNMTPSEIATQQQSQYGIQGGVPQLQATAQQNEASARIQEAANRARLAATSGLLNVPESEANVLSLGNTYQAGDYAGRTALQPAQFRLQGLNIGNDALVAQGLRDRIPQMNTLSGTDLNTQLSLAQARQSLLPASITQMRNEALTGAGESFHPPAMNNFFSANVDPTTGMLSLGRNPLGMNPQMAQYQAFMQGGLTGGNNNIQTVKLPSGQTIGIKTQAQPTIIDPLTGRAPVVPTTSGSVRQSITAPDTSSGTDTEQPNLLDQFKTGIADKKIGLYSSIKQIDDQLNDQDFNTRAKMYPGTYGAQRAQLIAQKQLLQQQLDEMSKIPKPTASSGRQSLMGAGGFSFPRSLQ